MGSDLFPVPIIREILRVETVSPGSREILTQGESLGESLNFSENHDPKSPDGAVERRSLKQSCRARKDTPFLLNKFCNLTTFKRVMTH